MKGILMLTRKQRELLLFIERKLQDEQVCPSFEEMKTALNLKSKSGIHRLVSALEDRGFIRRLVNKARALEVIKSVSDTADNENNSLANNVNGCSHLPNKCRERRGTRNSERLTMQIRVHEWSKWTWLDQGKEPKWQLPPQARGERGGHVPVVERRVPNWPVPASILERNTGKQKEILLGIAFPIKNIL